MPIPSLDERFVADAKGARIIKALISFRRKSLSSTAKRSLLIAFQPLSALTTQKKVCREQLGRQTGICSDR